MGHVEVVSSLLPLHGFRVSNTGSLGFYNKYLFLMSHLTCVKPYFLRAEYGLSFHHTKTRAPGLSETRDWKAGAK